jgi:hypothetical protein
MLDTGSSAAKIAISLNRSKPLISYYIKRLKKFGYVKEECRDVSKMLEVTQGGKHFLTMYENSNLNRQIYRVENLRFKAKIKKMPTHWPNEKKIEMNHWNKYCFELNDVKVHLNVGNEPTIEFLPKPIEGSNPEEMQDSLLQNCIEVAQELEYRLDMKIERLHKSSRDASKPKRCGEFEFFELSDAAEFMLLPQKVRKLEGDIETMRLNSKPSCK